MIWRRSPTLASRLRVFLFNSPGDSRLFILFGAPVACTRQSSGGSSVLEDVDAACPLDPQTNLNRRWSCTLCSTDQGECFPDAGFHEAGPGADAGGDSGLPDSGAR